MKQWIKSGMALVLGLVLLVGAVPMTVAAADNEIVVLAGSDFQVNDYSVGRGQVGAILRRMRYNNIRSFDGALFCGDYTMELDNKVEDSEEGYAQLMNVLGSVVSGPKVFVQGNHDPAGCSFLSKSGANDAQGYGVFVIHEDDYLSGCSATERKEAVVRTAAALKTYLDDKVSSRYNKPVFVLSHVPLHFSARTIGPGDASHANYLFDLLNEAGKKLNIFFLFGHDHNNGYDDYLGGAAIYLKKGDSINIAQASHTVYREETLNFTYMNAGYTGYYNNHNAAFGELTMTTFHIKGNAVTVARWYAGRDGMCDLKAAGVPSVNKGESGCAINTDVYASPRLVTLDGDVPTVLSIPTTLKTTTTTTVATKSSAVITTTTTGNRTVAIRPITPSNKTTSVVAEKATTSAAPTTGVTDKGTTTTSRETVNATDKITTTAPIGSITEVSATASVTTAERVTETASTTTVAVDGTDNTTLLSTTVDAAEGTVSTQTTSTKMTDATAVQDANAAPSASPVLWIVIAVIGVGAAALLVVLLVRKKKA